MSDVSLLGKIARYTEILSKDPSSTVFVPLAETYRQMGLLDDAMDVLRKGIGAQPRYAPGYTALGRLQIQRKALGEAERAFNKALDLDEENLPALRGLTRLHFARKEQDSARRLLQRIVSLKPDDQAAREMLDKLGEMPQQEATKPSEQAPAEPSAKPKVVSTPPPPHRRPAKDKGEPISTPTIAELYIRQGFPRRAMKVYRDLLKSDPQNGAIRRKLVELKEQVAREESASAQTQASVVEPAPEPEPVQQPPSEPTAETRMAPEAPPETPEGSRAAARTLERLDQWLEAIRRRRENVR